MVYLATNKITAKCASQQCNVGITISNNRWMRFGISKKWAVRNKIIDKCN